MNYRVLQLTIKAWKRYLHHQILRYTLILYVLNKWQLFKWRVELQRNFIKNGIKQDIREEFTIPLDIQNSINGELNCDYMKFSTKD